MSFQALFATLVAALLLLAAPAGAQDAAEPRFDLLEFEVEGNTVLPARDVEAALLSHMGPGRSMTDVEAARSALEAAFQQAGFLTVLVDVPEQAVVDGVVRLRVIEGRVDRVRVTGARWYDQGRIRAAVDQFAPGRVPDFNAAQAQLAELARPTRQVQPVLRPGVRPGTVDIELKVKDEAPLAGSIELKNHHTAGTEPLRLTGTLRYDNFFQAEHGLSLTAITAPQATEQSRVFVAAWTVPEGPASSWIVSLIASDSVLEPLGAGTVVGRGTTLGLRRAWTLFGAESVHTLALGGEWKHLNERISGGGSELSTPLRYLPLQLAHTAQWPQLGGRNTLAGTLTLGLRQLLQRDIDCPGNVGPVDQFACRRQGADGGFAALRLDWRHQRPLAGGLLALRLAGQWASQPLMGGEQFSIGGVGSVRGYNEGVAVGDMGLLGGAEWRSANLAPQLGAAALQELNLLAFAEAGRTRVLEPLPEQPARTPLAGAGLGLELRARGGLGAALELGWPLKRNASQPDLDPRLHARMGLNF